MRNMFRFSRLHESALVLGLLTVLLLQLFGSIERNNLLGDESAHLGAGYSYWEARDFRLNREHPPLVKLVGALPVWLEDQSTQQSWPHFTSAPEWDTTTKHQWDFGRILLLEDNGERLDSNLRAARRSETIFALCLAVCVYLLSRQLFGVPGGVVSLLALVFNPDVLAHGALVTTDMAMATFYFATVACLWWYFHSPSPMKLVGVGLLLGLGLASKYSNLLLPPVLAILLIAAWWLKPPCSAQALSWFNPLGSGPVARRAICLLAATLVVAAAAALVLWASYLYTEPFSQYWVGFQQINKNHNPGFENFLLGEYSVERFWSYFLVTTALKTPVPLFLLVVLAGAAFWVHWRKVLTPITWWVLFVPPLLLFTIISWKAANIGHRHVLGVYPYLFVLVGMAGYWLKDISQQTIRNCSILTLLTVLGAAATAYSGIRAYPFYLAYHNAFVPSDMEFIHYLDDSNNDWGQGWKETARVQEVERLPPMFVYQYFMGSGNQAGIQGNWVRKWLSSGKPAPGIHALSATMYTRNVQWFDQQALAVPLLQDYQPERIIAGSIVLIEVPWPSLVEQEHSLLTETSRFPNGQLQELSHYYLGANGAKVRSGLSNSWNEKGQLTQSAFYQDGQLSGPYTLWSNGRLAESGYMWNGRLHGTVRQWDDAGKLVNTFEYLEGTLMTGQ